MKTNIHYRKSNSQGARLGDKSAERKRIDFVFFPSPYGLG
jgi:hypothetical protein